MCRLSRNAGTPRLRYVFRPVLLPGCLSETEEMDQCADLGSGPYLTLPGFGVEMAVKNMEYSALDDRKVSRFVSTWLSFFNVIDQHNATLMSDSIRMLKHDSFCKV